MKNKILLFLAQINFVFPYNLGTKFVRYRKFLNKNHKSYNNTSDVLKMANHAIRNIPFYVNKEIAEVKTIDDFQKNIPLIDKELIMDQWNKFILPNYKKSWVVEGTTGGTSGKPLRLVIPKDRYIVELNTMNTMWENISWKGQIRAVIRNKQLKSNELFIVNPLKREVIFDGFNSSKEYYYQIYNTLVRAGIQYIHAYPSSAYQFATFLLSEKLDTRFIRAIFCGSEGLLPEQKNLIQDQLGIKIYHWYGHSEKLILGGYCRNSQLIHVEPTYGYFELLDEQGNAVSEIGEIGEMVGTGLHNPYMPLLRYRTGDYAEYAGNFCPHCKRHLPLLKTIHGRWDKNKIFRTDGSYITTTALNLHSDLYNKLLGLQYKQTVRGNLIVNIIKNTNFTDRDLILLNNHYKEAFGTENKVEIRTVQKLEKLPNGKFQNLISDLI